MAISNRPRLGWSVLGASLEEQDDNHRACSYDQTAYFDAHEFSEFNSEPQCRLRFLENQQTQPQVARGRRIEDEGPNFGIRVQVGPFRERFFFRRLNLVASLEASFTPQ